MGMLTRLKNGALTVIFPLVTTPEIMLREMECYLVGEIAGEERQAASEATVVERMGFVPDAWQARVLASGARQGILNCSRQCGKSTVTAVMAVERAYTEAESMTLVVSGGDRPVCPQGTH